MKSYTNAEKEKIAQEEFNKMVDELDEENLPNANIMVAGITGTGKSTLLNAIFGSDLAVTGKGKPVTDEIREYQNNDIPIHIWDTVGLELDSSRTKDSINSIRKTIADKAASENQFDRVHAIWYCINSGSSRYQGAELDFIKNLHSIGVPFIIVLTQCIGDPDELNKFAAQINEINHSMEMNDIDIIQVCAQDFNLRGFTIEAFGLDSLVETTLKKLPDFIKGGFIAAQKVSKEQKRLLCEEIIYEYVKAAKEGFWDKVPLLNIFKANRRIINLFKKIGTAYNTVLSEEAIEKIKTTCRIDAKNTFFGLVNPIDIGYSRKVTALLQQKKREGFEVQYSDFEHSEKVARLVAFYGYIFISSIEELWEVLTDEQLKNIDQVTDRLIEIINEKLNQQKKNIK